MGEVLVRYSGGGGPRAYWGVIRTREAPSNKALQLTWHSAFQSRSGSLLASTLGASATVGGLCHAAERPVRWAAGDQLRDVE